MKERVKRILTDLEAVRENLLALSDDIWLNIDHNNQEALTEGVRFKQAYNQKMGAFDELASDISTLIQQFTDVRIEGGADESPTDAAENQRIIRELDKETTHSVDEDFKYKRPYGFVLLGHAVTDIVTWRHLYERFCVILANADPSRAKALPMNPRFVGRRGANMFATDPKVLLKALKIMDGVYAEGNLSANDTVRNMKQLLIEFHIPVEQLHLYLREDRNAE